MNRIFRRAVEPGTKLRAQVVFGDPRDNVPVWVDAEAAGPGQYKINIPGEDMTGKSVFMTILDLHDEDGPL